MSGSSCEHLSDVDLNSDDTMGSQSSDDEAEIRFLNEVVIPNFVMRRERIPRNTSRLPGNDWVGEILMGTAERFYDNVRMTRPCFHALVQELTHRGLLTQGPHSRVSVVEEVIMFMRTVGMHIRQRDSMERFQHSLETINRHVRRVLNALVHLAPIFICPPKFDEIPSQVLHNPHFYPYFEGAIGAMDGTLIPAWVPTARQNAYRSRKATISQNVLAICDFNLMFTYVYAGWEGSASDAHVLFNAIRNDPTFPWPPQGKYYLVDAGYTNYGAFLAPYRQTRYHLNEFRSTGLQARTPDELFNHRHSRLRNSIERCFGILKSRFPILKWGMPSYRIPNQVKLVIACCVVHNFIRRSGMEDEIFEERSEHNVDDEETFYQRGHPGQPEIQAQSQFRDSIANAMWQNREV